jgi:hypothetical protein
MVFQKEEMAITVRSMIDNASRGPDMKEAKITRTGINSDLDPQT